MYAWGIGGSDLFEFEISFLAFQSYCWRHDPPIAQKVHVAVFTFVALMWARAEHRLCHICYLLRLLAIPPFQLNSFFLIICICKNPKFHQIGRSLKFQPPWCDRVYMITILVHFLLIPAFLHHQALVIHCTFLEGGTWGVASPCTQPCPAAVLDLLFSTQPST